MKTTQLQRLEQQDTSVEVNGEQPIDVKDLLEETNKQLTLLTRGKKVDLNHYKALREIKKTLEKTNGEINTIISPNVVNSAYSLSKELGEMIIGFNQRLINALNFDKATDMLDQLGLYREGIAGDYRKKLATA